MYRFSELSRMRLSGCHTDLILLANMSIGNSPHDFKITEGHRSPQRQFDLYKRGRSYIGEKWVIVDKSKVVTNVDGIKKKSKHNHIPALAFDIQVLVDGKGTWKFKYYEDVAEHIINVAQALLEESRINHAIRWGGTFSKLVDGPHFEII